MKGLLWHFDVGAYGDWLASVAFLKWALKKLLDSGEAATSLGPMLPDLMLYQSFHLILVKK